MRSSRPLRGSPPKPKGLGYFVQGPHFYIWDDNIREVAQRASELLESSGDVLPRRPAVTVSRSPVRETFRSS